jgi:hypothetical protein
MVHGGAGLPLLGQLPPLLIVRGEESAGEGARVVKLSSNRIAWQYHADNGQTYRVAAQKALTDQNKLGGEAWAGVVGPKPATIKMRRITVRAAGVGSRVLPVYSTGAAILTAGQTVNANFLDDSHAFTSSGTVISEQQPRQSVTQQAG